MSQKKSWQTFYLKDVTVLILDPQDHFKYSSVYMGYLQQPLKTSHSS
jgi:hypothetical protein